MLLKTKQFILVKNGFKSSSPQTLCFKDRNFPAFGLRHRNIFILIYIQHDATLHSLFYLETALHVSVGIITHHQERKQLYLQHRLFVTLYWIELNLVTKCI
jgi:hypothetical protein